MIEWNALLEAFVLKPTRIIEKCAKKTKNRHFKAAKK